MPDTISKVDYYSMFLPNQPGEGALHLSILSEAGVSLSGLWGYPVGGGAATIDLIPADTAAFKRAVKKAGLKVSDKKSAFLVQGKDRPGAVAAWLAILGAAGINVRAAQAVCAGSGRYGAVIQVEPADVRKAAKVLGV